MEVKKFKTILSILFISILFCTVKSHACDDIDMLEIAHYKVSQYAYQGTFNAPNKGKTRDDLNSDYKFEIIHDLSKIDKSSEDYMVLNRLFLSVGEEIDKNPHFKAVKISFIDSVFGELTWAYVGFNPSQKALGCGTAGVSNIVYEE